MSNSDCIVFVKQTKSRGRPKFDEACATCGVVYSEHKFDQAKVDARRERARKKAAEAKAESATDSTETEAEAEVVAEAEAETSAADRLAALQAIANGE